MLYDASQWLIYFPEHMDTRQALWFVRDILDVDAVRDNAVALAIGAGFQDFKTCEPFLSAFPSVFLALADGELVDTVADALAEFAPSVPVLKPAPGAFRDHANIREVLKAGGQRAVDHLMIGAVERPAAGLLDLAAVERQENPPAVFTVARPIIEANNARRTGGKKGGRPKKKTIGFSTKETIGSNDEKPDALFNIEMKNEEHRNEESPLTPHGGKRERFTPPSVEEVAAYCQERRNGIDPEEFVCFYASKGWRVGQSPMKSWKHAVITWEKKRKSSGKEDPYAGVI